MNYTEKPLHSFEYALLGFLVPSPCHGYELHRLVADPAGIGIVRGMKMSNLYAQLVKLEKKGLIRGTVQPKDNRPARTEYSLTQAGRDTFEQWLTCVTRHPRDFKREFLLRVFFLSRYHPDQLEAAINDQQRECEVWLKGTTEKCAEAATNGTFPTLVNQFRFFQINSMIEWLKWLQSQLPTIPSL